MNIANVPISVIIAAVFMVLAFVGMIICARKQQTNEAAKPAAIALMGVVLVCAFVILYNTGIFGDRTSQQFFKNELKYNEAAGFILGQYLAEKCPGAKALLVVDKRSNQVQDEQKAGLMKGFAGKITISAESTPSPAAMLPPGGAPAPEGGAAPAPAEGAPAAPPPPGPGGPPGGPMGMPRPEEFMSIREMMKATDFDSMLMNYPDCTLVISLIGLPQDVENMAVWTMEETPEKPKPKFALLNSDIYVLRQAIASGSIAAVVTFSPGAKFDESRPPEDMKAAFDRRYLLITPDNIEEISAKYTGIFQPAKE